MNTPVIIIEPSLGSFIVGSRPQNGQLILLFVDTGTGPGCPLPGNHLLDLADHPFGVSSVKVPGQSFAFVIILTIEDLHECRVTNHFVKIPEQRIHRWNLPEHPIIIFSESPASHFSHVSSRPLKECTQVRCLAKSKMHTVAIVGIIGAILTPEICVKLVGLT